MVGWKRRSLALLVCLYQVVQMVLQGIKDGLDIRDHKNQSHSMTVMYSHSFHRAGAAHPHPPHRVRAPPHLEFGRSPSGCGVENDCQCDVWVTLYYPLYPCLAPVHVNVQAPARYQGPPSGHARRKMQSRSLLCMLAGLSKHASTVVTAVPATFVCFTW